MTPYETLSLVIGMVNTIVILGSLIFAYRQIKLLVNTHSDNHEWNRRSATQETLMSLTLSGTIDKAVSYLLEQDRTTPIPKDEIFAKFKEHPDLQTETHIMLNFFEALARGVKYGIYDEDIIKNARHGSMRRCLIVLREYINHSREQNHKYWIELEQLVQKWNGDDISLLGKPPIGSVK